MDLKVTVTSIHVPQDREWQQHVVFHEMWEFPDKLNDYQLFNKTYAQWN
jgi:hypothetical protein